MNILIITPLFPPLTGGAATYYDTLTKTLSTHDRINFFILTSRVQQVPPKEHTLQGIIYRLLRKQTGSTTTSSQFIAGILFLFNQLWISLLISYFILCKRIDLIHIHGVFCREQQHGIKNPLPNFLNEIPVPVILDLRDPPSCPNNSDFFDDAIFASKNVQRQFLDNASPRNSEFGHYIPLPFEPPKHLEPNIPKVKQRIPYLLYVGSISPNKGIFELLDAYLQLQSNHEVLNLIFVGHDYTSGDFPAKIEDFSTVYYLGPRSHEETLSIIESAELLVLPSFTEAFGRVCLESFCLETKFIFPKQVLELYKHFPEFAIEESTPELIRKKITHGLNNPMNGTYPLDNHAPTKCAKATRQLYEKYVQSSD